MKQSLCNICLAVATLLAPSVFGWPVTNSPTGGNWEPSSAAMDFRTVVARALMLNHFDAQGRDSCDLVIEYAKSQGIPMSNVVDEAKTIAEEGFAMLESGSITNVEVKAAILRYCQKALVLVCRPRDPSALSYLESKTNSSDEHIRWTAANGIINILGPDAIGFIRVAVTNGLYSDTDLHSMYKTFGGRFKAGKRTFSKDTQAKAYAFLFELLEKVESGSTVKMVDQVLCETLEGYSASVQREKVADRMVKAGPEYSRSHFEAVKAEIEKTPTAKRKDFAAKGELLDPERTKE